MNLARPTEQAVRGVVPHVWTWRCVLLFVAVVIVGVCVSVDVTAGVMWFAYNF